MVYKKLSLGRGPFYLLLASFFSAILKTPARAQVTFGDLPPREAPTLQMFEGVVYNTTRAVFALAGLGAFIYLIMGGFKYLTAGSDPKALDEAQKTIAHAVIGLAITVFVYFFLKVLSKTFYGGPALLQFNLPAPSQ